MDVEPDKLAWPAALFAAVFGGGGVWAWLTARGQSKRSPPAAMVTAAGDFAEAAAKVAETFGEVGAKLAAALNAELLVVRIEVGELRESVKACEDRHDECEERVREIRAEFDTYVKTNPPAEYSPSDLQRPAK